MNSVAAFPQRGTQLVHETPASYEGDTDSSVTDDSYSDDSEDEAAKRTTGEIKVSVKELLGSVLDDFNSGTREFKDLKDSERSHLAQKTGDAREPTALHVLAITESKHLPSSAKLNLLIEYLVRHPARLLTSQDHAGLTPLYLVVSERRRRMATLMCEAYDDIDSVLSISSHETKNCLHVAIEKRVKFIDVLIKHASAETLSAKDNDGNTPLHLAVECKRCRAGHLATVKAIVDKCDRVMRDSQGGDFNNASLSPYSHHLDTCAKAQKDKAERERRRRKKREEDEETRMSRADKEARKEIKRGDRRSQLVMDDSAARDGGHRGGKLIPSKTPAAPMASSHGRDPKRNTLQHIDTHADVPTSPARDARRERYGAKQQRRRTLDPPTVGMAPDSFVSGRDDKRASRTKDASARRSGAKTFGDRHVAEIGDFLKLHYLRERGHDAALEILYGRNTTSDQAIYFDLFGYPTITQNGIKKTLSILNFEDVQQYVAIPKISIQGESNVANTRKARGRPRRPDGDGRTDLISVFSSLHSKGVKTILKVIVDDLEHPAHSDLSIVTALDNKGVEIWDWRKLDLCTEVVRKVAPNVRQVHLYWSGNNAILRGWSEEGGLKQLGLQLKTVHLHVQQGLETRASTQDNVTKFVGRMRILCPGVHVEQYWPAKAREVIDLNGLQTATDHADRPLKHEWIECMSQFKELLFNAERCLKAISSLNIETCIDEQVVVALIDDGINVNELECSRIRGRSFCTRDEDHNLNYPYYVSSGGHGTIMASQIYRICPRVELYVLKLDDYALEPPARQITLKSAAQAIRAAVRKKVHIICMSWTIDPPEDENQSQQIADLESAIAEAVKANILMFCSASDKGAKHTVSYPSKATNSIFTIGAADADGAMASFVGDINLVDFIFPGNQVEPEGISEVVTKNVKYWTGSSVATALAGGLAALILYCAQIRIVRASTSQKEKARKDFQALKKHDKMMKAFTNIGATRESKYKYLTVWEVFGKAVAERENCDPDEWIDLVAEAGDNLCMKL